MIRDGWLGAAYCCNVARAVGERSCCQCGQTPVPLASRPQLVQDLRSLSAEDTHPRQGYAAIKERFSAAVAAQNAALLRAKADAAHPATGDAAQRCAFQASAGLRLVRSVICVALFRLPPQVSAELWLCEGRHM